MAVDYSSVWGGGYSGAGSDEQKQKDEENTTADALQDTTSSFTGLPSWASDYVKTMFASYGDTISDYSKAVSNLTKAPKWIDTQRKLLNQQYTRELQNPTMSTLKSGINSLAGRGMVNSSVSGDWISNIASEMLSNTLSQQTKTNVWAADKKYQNMLDQVTAQKDFASILGDYLGLTQYTESEGAQWVLTAD